MAECKQLKELQKKKVEASYAKSTAATPWDEMIYGADCAQFMWQISEHYKTCPICKENSGEPSDDS